jgi:Tfp pilus assembly protein PilF
MYCAELARTLDPANLEVLDHVGRMYALQGDTSRANHLFLQAIAAAPQVSTYHYHFGLSLLQRRQPQYAREEFQTALACHPSDEERALIEGALVSLDPPK